MVWQLLYYNLVYREKSCDVRQHVLQHTVRVSQLRTEFLINRLHQRIAVPTFGHHGYDGVLIRENDG